MTKHLVKYSLAVMTALLLLALVWQFRIAVVYLLVSVMLAATLRPIVTLQIRQGVLEQVIRILLYILILGSISFLLYIVGRVTFKEIQELSNAISTQNEWKLPTWLRGSLFQQVLVTRLLPPSKLLQAAMYGLAQYAVPTVLGVTQRIASVVSGVIIILIMSLYWIANKNNFERLWLSLLPSAQRSIAREIWLTIELDLGASLRRQFIHSSLVGLLLGLGFWWMDSPYPLLLALACALACLLPFIGVVLAVILPLFVGLLTGLPLTWLMVLYTLSILIVLGVWVEPRIFHPRWENPILTLVILIFLASALGLVGIVLAPLISSICQILWSLLINQRAAPSAEQSVDFKQRLKSIQATIDIMDGPLPLLVSSTMERLTQLIEKAEPLLQPVEQDDPASFVRSGTHQPDRE